MNFFQFVGNEYACSTFTLNYLWKSLNWFPNPNRWVHYTSDGLLWLLAIRLIIREQAKYIVSTKGKGEGKVNFSPIMMTFFLYFALVFPVYAVSSHYAESSNTFRHLNFKPSGEGQCKAFHKTQVKLFPNVTSICIPFDCLLISWTTTTCMIVILTSLLYQDLQSLKA